MNKVLTFIAVALALAAVPAISGAQDGSPAFFGAAGYEVRNRLTVKEVWPGSTADLIGLRAEDVITHGGGKRISSEAKMRAFVGSLRVGDPVELTVRRKGKVLQLKGTAVARLNQRRDR
jgi:S1-C subfamily serine protease